MEFHYENNYMQRYQNGCIDGFSSNVQSVASNWTSNAFVKSSSIGSQNHKKQFSNRNGGIEYDDISMSRLARHTHGAPIIMSNRYRNRSTKPTQSFGQDNGNLRLYNNGFVKVTPPDDANDIDDFNYPANGTCLPRIIKPRKRRKKDRKPIVGNASMENKSPNPYVIAANQSNGFVQNMNNVNVFYNTKSEHSKRSAPPNESSRFFNCDFDPTSIPLSTTSSPVSLSTSSLSSSTTASSNCSCRLCEPNCKIWAFPLRRSFSDNSASELDHSNNNASIVSSDGLLIETNKKNVGVIGGNRVKSEWHSAGESTLSILEMIELSCYQQKQQQQNQQTSEVDRFRTKSQSESNDIGCDLLFGGLNISDDILSTTLKAVADGRTFSDEISAITQQVSEINLEQNHENHLNINENNQLNNLSTSNFNNSNFEAMTAFKVSDHQHENNLDNFLALMSSANSFKNGNFVNARK